MPVDENDPHEDQAVREGSGDDSLTGSHCRSADEDQRESPDEFRN